MLLKLNSSTEYYHGTSQNRLDSIKKNGFLVGDPHYNNWLAPNGIYFVLNRPLIARRFALMVSSEDMSTPVVIAVKISCPEDNKILDLTTDFGMHLLYIGYTDIERSHKQSRRKKKSRAPQSYTESLNDSIGEMDEWLKEIFSDKSEVNWDSVSIRYIADLLGIDLIIAAIQEGTAYNLSIAKEQIKHHISKNYKGLRYRDHIELCVLNPNLIIADSIEVRDEKEDEEFFESGFAYAILDWRTPDASE